MITITVEIDNSCEMVRVNDDCGNGMEGNFWDFHNSCHGLYELDEFNNVSEFVEALKKLHGDKEIKVVNSKYDYTA